MTFQADKALSFDGLRQQADLAQSQFHDIGISKQLGIIRRWIERGWGLAKSVKAAGRGL